MFSDPLDTVSVNLPPVWAFNPLSSSLTNLVFLDWTSPTTRWMAVSVQPTLVLPGARDDEWAAAVESCLSSGIRRIEHRDGPVVLAERSEGSEAMSARLAWMRGPRLDVLIGQYGTPAGSALATPDLLEAVRTVNVPVNRRVVDHPDLEEWKAATDAARQASAKGDDVTAARHLTRARLIAKRAWLHELTREPAPDAFMPAREAEAALSLAALARWPVLLHEGTTTLFRCRNSQASAVARTPTDDFIDDMLGEALDLHRTLGGGPRPTDAASASLQRSGILLEKLAELEERAKDGRSRNSASWKTLGEVATLASEDAKTAVAAIGQGRTSRYDRLSPAEQATLSDLGVKDSAAWQQELRECEIVALDRLASAGAALCRVLLGPVSVSAYAMRADALLAARRLTELAPTPERYRTLARIMHGTAGALSELGDQPSLDAARALLDEAQAVLDDHVGDGPDGRIAIESANAWLAYKSDDVPAGLAATDRALAIAHRAHVEDRLGVVRGDRARLLIRAGRHAEALAEARRAVALLSDHTASAAYETLALALHETGDRAAALEAIRDGLAVALAYNPIGEGVQNLLSSAAVIAREADPATALAASEAAALLFDLGRRDIGGAGERIAYDDAGENRRLTADLVERCLDVGDVLGAFAAADHGRARSLLDVRGTLRDPGEGVAGDTLAGDASLADQIAFAARTAATVLEFWGVPPLLGGAALSAAVREHGRTVVLFQPTDDAILVFIARPGDPVVVDHRVASVPLARIRETLAGLTDHLRIEVASRAARGRPPPLSPEELDEAFREESRDDRLEHLLREIHDGLFSEVVPLLRDDEPVVVVPYRELSIIPFAALTSADRRTLVERHPLSLLPSVGSLAALARPSGAPPRAVIVGNPRLPAEVDLASLPGAEDEARVVKKMLDTAGVDTEVLPGPSATEERFRTAAANARLVLLACHAALGDSAAESALFLAPSGHEDGLLLPAEIADLKLDGALVVLSACQTGVGRATADGVLGLGRAFMQAGARAVVVSLWRVMDDLTAAFMPELFGGLLGTGEGVQTRLDVAAALQRAQLVTRRTVAPDVSAWGPWLLVGDGGWRLD